MAIEVKIDGYDSLEQVAVGGMAAVYKARKTSIDKVVAIKVLFPYLANDESFIDRFQREAKSAAKVQHENIVNVVDFGDSDGCYYIVMEFYEGLTIADLLKDHRMPLDIAVLVLLDVCFGLEAAHAKDIIHRDIKPANIIFTHQGGIKIADFGLAKKSDTMTVVTQPGKVLGTPAYMSPEQAAGDNVGTQSDLFSLGVVAYEMFCNRRPFEGSSYSDVLERIQTYDLPPIVHENPLIQPDIEGVIIKLLQKDVSRRYQDIAEVIVDLEKAMERLEIKRDRRRLQKYMKDPIAYDQAFKEKMVSKYLSQGTYYMQKGKTHITDAIQEFKRILFLDPTNERARKHLAKLLADHPDENSTVAIDVPGAGPGRAKTKRNAKSTPSQKSKQKAKPSGASRQKSKPSLAKIIVPFVVLTAIAVTFGAWWLPAMFGDATNNSAPMISSPSSLTVTEGERVAFKLNVIDADGDSLRVYAEHLPPGAALSDDGDFSWDVSYEHAGKHNVQFFAHDGTESTESATLIEVLDKKIALDFQEIREVTTQVGKPISVRLQAGSAVGQPVQFGLGDEPRGMKLKGDRISWTPGKNQVGTHRVPVNGNDGVASAEQTLVVRVKDVTPPKPRRESGRLEWVLPKLANIYVDGKLTVREDTYLSVNLPEGRHKIRAELLDGLTAFEEIVNVKGNKTTRLDPPRLAYGKLSAYFLGGVGELWLNGKKFKEQPPFSTVVLPAGRYTAACQMFKEEDTRKFEVEVKEGKNTVIEYEVGSDPSVEYE